MNGFSAGAQDATTAKAVCVIVATEKAMGNVGHQDLLFYALSRLFRHCEAVFSSDLDHTLGSHVPVRNRHMGEDRIMSRLSILLPTLAGRVCRTRLLLESGRDNRCVQAPLDGQFSPLIARLGLLQQSIGGCSAILTTRSCYRTGYVERPQNPA